MKLTAGTEAQAGIREGTAAKIERRVKDWLDTGYTPMAQYFAAHSGVVFLDGAQGLQSPGKDDALLTVDSIFPVASITKVFTATLVMILCEDGLLAPTDFVYRHIPEFNGEGKDRVTIAHLMTHSAGIEDGDIWEVPEEEIEKTVISRENLEKYPHLDKRFYARCALPNKRAPGVQMSYSSFSQSIVGEIISRVTGQPFERVMRERLFEPLRMTSTFLGVPESVWDRVVGYPDNAFFSWFNDPESRKSLSPSGGAYSNARDLCVYGQMLLNKGEYGGVRVLSRLSVEAMTRNQIPGVPSFHEGRVFPEAGWGFSFMLSLDKFDETGTLRSRETFGHSGAGCSMFIGDPVNGVVAALLDCTLKREGDDFHERRFDRFYNMVFSGVI